MKKWYYTYHSNSYDISIFETDEYQGRNGYDTKKEATDAAIFFIQKELLQKSKTIENYTEQSKRLSSDMVKLTELLIKVT